MDLVTSGLKSQPPIIGGKGKDIPKLNITTERKGTQMSESNNLDIDQVLNKLAELLAQKLEERKSDTASLLDRVTDLEDRIDDFSEDDIRDWISDAINNATITIES
jgi:hypothetical protein|tara:strand:- start:113 stop:430 length:318 start_codon:yes stop_codon:yes gene_type:complete